MAFTDDEVLRFGEQIEKLFWSKHRPPLHLRDKVREGHRVEKSEIVLFFVRPHFRDSTQEVYEQIAKTRFVRSRNVWQVYWWRADGKWHLYPPRPEVKSLQAFLKLVSEDANCCFFG